MVEGGMSALVKPNNSATRLSRPGHNVASLIFVCSIDTSSIAFGNARGLHRPVQPVRYARPTGYLTLVYTMRRARIMGHSRLQPCGLDPVAT